MLEPDRPRHHNASGDVVATIIPYRNGWALASYYVGIFALIPCLGLLLGPLAIIFGALGLRRRAKEPEAKGMVHAIIGLVLGIMTFLMNTAALLFLFAAPAPFRNEVMMSIFGPLR